MPFGPIHRAVLGTRRTPVLSSLYRGAYRAAAEAAGRALGALPGVRSVVLHRGLSRGDCEPGVSDIDLLVVCSEGPEAALERPASRFWALRRVFPMLGDLWLGTEAEVRTYLEWGGLRAWEDAPEWEVLRGAAVDGLDRAGRGPGEDKRLRLDPWVWVFVSFMDISRRLFRPGPGPAEKADADLRKLYLDLCRYADFLLGGPKAGDRPRTRAESRLLRPEAGRRAPEELWLEAVSMLERASLAAGRLLRPGPRVRPAFPAVESGSPEEGPLGSLLEASKDALCAVFDPPYHAYVVLRAGAPAAEYRRLASRLRAGGALAGVVPLAVPEPAWELALQSSYLGAPLGWLEPAGVPAVPARGGLFAGWGPRLAGEAPAVRRLPLQLRRETAAEAASWMGLWRRPLWTHPSFGGAFTLFHLYTRTLGLRLELEGRGSGPFADWNGLLSRCARAHPGERELLDSLERFAREEPLDCVETLPRSSFSPGHREALGGWAAALREAVHREAGACPR